MIEPKKTQIVTDLDMRTQFEFSGVNVACYGNMDQEEIYVVDPATLEVTGKPQEDVEYPMLRSGVNNLTCKFYRNATVTKQADDLMREHTGMTGQRDWYDVTMLVRLGDKPVNLESIGAGTRKAKPALPEGHSAEVIPLF